MSSSGGNFAFGVSRAGVVDSFDFRGDFVDDFDDFEVDGWDWVDVDEVAVEHDGCDLFDLDVFDRLGVIIPVKMGIN